MLAARYGPLIPASPPWDSVKVGDDEWIVRKVHLGSLEVDAESAPEGGEEQPPVVSSHYAGRGIVDREGTVCPVNRSFMTALGHHAMWRRTTTDRCCAPEWFYYLSDSPNKRCVTVLAGDLTFATVKGWIGQGGTGIRDACLKEDGAHGVAVMEWTSEPSERRWTFLVWRPDEGWIRECEPGHQPSAQRLTVDGKALEPLIQLLSHCHFKNAQPGAVPSCYPQVVFDGGTVDEGSRILSCAIGQQGSSVDCVACTCANPGVPDLEKCKQVFVGYLDSQGPHFGPLLGWHRHILWPLAPLGNERSAAIRGLAVFSLPQLSPAPAGGGAISSLSLLQRNLFSEAVDYLEFIIGQQAEREKAFGWLAAMSHSLRRRMHLFNQIGDSVKNVEEQLTSLESLNVTDDAFRYWSEKFPQGYPDQRVRQVAVLHDALKNIDSEGQLGRNLIPLVQELSWAPRVAFRTNRVMTALNLFLTGQPEPLTDFEAGTVFSSAYVWITDLLSQDQLGRWYPGDDNFFKRMRAGCDQITLKNLFALPAGTLEIVLEEIVVNARIHGKPGTLSFKCSREGNGERLGWLVLDCRNEKNPDAKAGTGLGIRLIKRALEASFGECCIERQTIGDDYEIVLRLNLDSYKGGGLEHQPAAR